MSILIDTNILVAYSVEKDKYHIPAKMFLQSLNRDIERIIPAPVLVELFFLVVARTNYQTGLKIIDYVRQAFQIEPLTDADMQRMSALISKYVDLELDYVDAAMVAVAERLNIKRIATFDRRDFSVIRPNHVESLELLP